MVSAVRLSGVDDEADPTTFLFDEEGRHPGADPPSKHHQSTRSAPDDESATFSGVAGQGPIPVSFSRFGVGVGLLAVLAELRWGNVLNARSRRRGGRRARHCPRPPPLHRGTSRSRPVRLRQGRRRGAHRREPRGSADRAAPALSWPRPPSCRSPTRSPLTRSERWSQIEAARSSRSFSFRGRLAVGTRVAARVSS